MTQNRIGAVVCASALTALLAAGALAQRPGAPGAGFGGGPGMRAGGGAGQGPGRGGGQGRGFGRGPRGPVTLANVPVEALKKPLALSAEQAGKIEAIQDKQRDSVRALFPLGGGGPPGGGPGGRPGMGGGPSMMGGRPGGGPPGGAQADMQKILEKVRASEAKSIKAVEVVLTSAQKARAPGLLKQLETIRGAGIPLQVAGDLNLTPAQLRKLDVIAQERRNQMRQFAGGPGRPGGPDGVPGAGPARLGMSGAGPRVGPGGPGGPGMGPGGGGMEQFRAMREARRKKVDAILTAKQRAVLKKWEDSRARGNAGMRSMT
jgi:hypothetical protein